MLVRASCHHQIQLLRQREEVPASRLCEPRMVDLYPIEARRGQCGDVVAAEPGGIAGNRRRVRQHRDAPAAWVLAYNARRDLCTVTSGKLASDGSPLHMLSRHGGSYLTLRW